MDTRSRLFARRQFLSRLCTLTGGLAVLPLVACGGNAPAAVTVAPSATAATVASAATSVASAAATTSASAAATSTSASAAANPTATAPPVPALKIPTGAKVTIRLSSWGALTIQNVPVYNAFMAQNPDVAIGFDQVGSFSEYFTKVQAQTASGDAPDVITHSPYYHVVFAARQVTRVLEDLVSRDKVDLTQLYAPVVDSCRWEAGRIATGAGKLYVMPANLNTGTLYFFNKTLFDQSGVKYPDDTWTWDTMRESALKLSRAAGSSGSQQWGLGLPEDGNGRINTWIWQGGGDFFDKNFTACTLRSDGKAYDAFSYLVDLVQKQKVAASPSTGDRIKLFTNGAAAMTPGGMWWSQTIAQTRGLEWDVFLPPKHTETGSRTVDVYTNGFAIGTTSKHVDEAWRYIRWYTVGDGLPAEIANFPGFVPAHIATAEKYVFNPQRTDPPKSLYRYADVLKNAHPTFVVAGEGDIASAVGKPQTDAFSGAQAVDAVATSIQSTVTSILNQQRAQLGL